MLTNLLTAVMAAGLSAGGVDSPATDELVLERAARAYRIQVYETFHLDRAEFDARRAEWDRVSVAWQNAGKPNNQIPVLIEWLESAKSHSLPDSIEPLPEAPAIVGEVKQATPVSSKATLNRSLLDEKKPSEPGPASRPASPEPADSSDGQPTKPAGGAAWLHSLGQQFGEDLNDLALTLSWKRESK